MLVRLTLQICRRLKRRFPNSKHFCGVPRHEPMKNYKKLLFRYFQLLPLKMRTDGFNIAAIRLHLQQSPNRTKLPTLLRLNTMPSRLVMEMKAVPGEGGESALRRKEGEIITSCLISPVEGSVGTMEMGGS